MEERLLHPERLKQFLAKELVEALAGGDLGDAPECIEGGERAVSPPRAGLEVEGCGRKSRDNTGQRLAVQFCEFRHLRGARRAAASQTRDMCEQILNRDLAQCWDR